jgi:hypothetical protein
MSYTTYGLGEALPDLIIQWSDGYGMQSAILSAKGPECGYQIATQVALNNLGYGAGKPNMKDPTWLDAVAKFAAARGIVQPAGQPPTDAVCARMMSDWKSMAEPTPANARVWQVKPGAAPPAPKACAPGFDWNQAEQRCQLPEPPPPAVVPVAMPPIPITSVAQPTTPGGLTPGPMPFAPPPGPAAMPAMPDTVKYAIIGGGALLLVGIMLASRPKRKPPAAAPAA